MEEPTLNGLCNRKNLFNNGNNERSTEPAQLKKGQDERKRAYYTESITLPVAKVAREFKITCCDKNDKNGRALGDTRETLTDALNKNGPPDNDKNLFNNGNNERSTEPAQLKKGQDERKRAYYTESITLPVAKVAREFKITCCDKNDKNGRALGDTRETLTDALNKNGPPDNDVGKGRKVQLELFSNDGIVGKVILYIMFLAMEAPGEQMRRIEHKSLRGQMIGIMIIDDIKVKNINRHKGYLRVMLGNEKASTEKYLNTSDTECPYGIILPVAKDLWIKLMKGGQVSVPEISFSIGSILAAMWYLKSAEEGNINGQNKLVEDNILANCYFYGIGTTKDDYEIM
ncbi:hypothetical protein Glove_184g106 [Diversispora epigaea]|uniref:Uncharacterized protein n=1 Tax=Diversispora epigaea TaxID=1348612 RepID=A0A397IMI6_9GLOM|nr:hypothetical protein Glove_184g106 [Diversispora epigaea]